MVGTVNPLDFIEPGAVALLITILLYGIYKISSAFIKGEVVAKATHDREIARGDRLEAQVQKASTALAESAEAQKLGAEKLKALAEEVKDLRAEIRGLR